MAGWRLWRALWQNTPRLPAGARHYLLHHPQMRAIPSVRAGNVGPAGAGSDSRYPPHFGILTSLLAPPLRTVDAKTATHPLGQE